MIIIILCIISVLVITLAIKQWLSSPWDETGLFTIPLMLMTFAAVAFFWVGYIICHFSK